VAEEPLKGNYEVEVNHKSQIPIDKLQAIYNTQKDKGKP
jgi:hypothetical protein